MADVSNIYQRLSEVQRELKAPKGQYNSFGKYSYRSAEDILEAVKPLLGKHDLVLVVTDELVNIGDRYYVKATAVVHDSKSDTEQSVYADGYAREDETKKGMDGSQITGAASSYARKYALNGLFNIDDTKDADTDEHHRATAKPAPQRAAPAKQVDPLENLQDELADLMRPKFSSDQIRAAMGKLKTEQEYRDAIAKMKGATK